MALTTMIILTWLICTIFFLSPKRLSFLQNFTVFMLLTILSRHVMTILTMKLQLIETTKDPVVYIFFILEREVFTPVATLLFINYFNRLEKLTGKATLFIIILLGILSLDNLSTYLNVVEYQNWNYFYSIIYEGVFLFIGLGLSKIVLALDRKGVQA